MTPMPLRIAHRGMPLLARENTLASFALALERGADGIELDVHAAADGVVVVHHDARLADGTPIAALRGEQVTARDAAPGAAIPTLAQVLALVGARATLFVEAKGADMERELIDALAGHAGPLSVHSFDHALVARLHALDRTLLLGVLLDEGWDAGGRLDALMATTGATDLWPHHSLVSPALVARAHAAGARVIAWTVNEPERASELAGWGVDGLCTDDVSMLGGLGEADDGRIVG